MWTFQSKNERLESLFYYQNYCLHHVHLILIVFYKMLHYQHIQYNWKYRSPLLSLVFLYQERNYLPVTLC
nr:MAG TPA: hypothetical protein [Caudoviricetes sp.]